MNMRILPLLIVPLIFTGCAVGIERTGYKLPPGQTSNNLPRRPIAIQSNVLYSTNDVEVLGSIRSYDTGFSTDCDEAGVLDTFCREANMLNADIVDITEEKQPSVWTSTCYRAAAEFLRFKDREKAGNLVSDARYAPELIVERSAKFSKRSQEVIAGAVFGGLLGAIVVSAATEPYHPLNHTNSVPANWTKKP